MAASLESVTVVTVEEIERDEIGNVVKKTTTTTSTRTVEDK